MAEAGSRRARAPAPRRLRPVRLGPADVTLDRKPDGTIFLRSPHALRALSRQADGAAGALGEDRARPRLHRAAHRRGRLAQAELRADAGAGARHRAGVAVSASFPPSGRSRSCPATTSSTHCWRSRRCIVGIPYAPISVPYSLMSSDFGKLKSIIADLTPGLVFVSDGKPFARAIDAAVPLDAEVVVTANPLGNRSDHDVRRSRCDRADRRGRCRARQGRSRHDRKDPLHLGLDRLSEGRHQHAAHAVLQPGDDPRRASRSSATSRR